MKDTESIEIAIEGLNHIYLKIVPSKKVVEVKNRFIPISEDKIYELISIITPWEEVYEGPNYIDSEEYTITIKEKMRTIVFRGKGEIPSNYSRFKDWLKEFID